VIDPSDDSTHRAASGGSTAAVSRPSSAPIPTSTTRWRTVAGFVWRVGWKAAHPRTAERAHCARTAASTPERSLADGEQLVLTGGRHNGGFTHAGGDPHPGHVAANHLCLLLVEDGLFQRRLHPQRVHRDDNSMAAWAHTSTPRQADRALPPTQGGVHLPAHGYVLGDLWPAPTTPAHPAATLAAIAHPKRAAPLTEAKVALRRSCLRARQTTASWLTTTCPNGSGQAKRLAMTWERLQSLGGFNL
jgi:hypothetical protein